LLDYISNILPPPLYSILLTFLSHSLALATSLFSLVISLISSKPWEWDAQTVIPPLITILAAYLALTSIYRSTTWMIRTSFWFLKWGSIFAALLGGAGYYMGMGGGNGNGIMGLMGVPGAGGIVTGLGGMLLDMINGQGQNAAGGSRGSRSQASRSRKTKTGSASSSRNQKPKEKPKPWDSFEAHRDWQYQQDAAAEDGNDVQKVLGDILGAVKDSGWWEIAKGVVDGALNGNEDADDEGGDQKTRRKQPERKAKTGRKTGSR